MTATEVPKEVLLCAINYRVTVAEDMVLFADTNRCGPCFHRMAFQRKCGCWYMTGSSLGGGIMVAHVIAAYECLCKWFGGDHEFKHGENTP